MCVFLAIYQTNANYSINKKQKLQTKDACDIQFRRGKEKEKLSRFTFALESHDSFESDLSWKWAKLIFKVTVRSNGVRVRVCM